MKGVLCYDGFSTQLKSYTTRKPTPILRNIPFVWCSWRVCLRLTILIQFDFKNMYANSYARHRTKRPLFKCVFVVLLEEREKETKNCVQVEYICGSLFTRECTQCGSVALLEIDTEIETDSLLQRQRCVCLSFQWFKVVEWNILQYKLQENGIQP